MLLFGPLSLSFDEAAVLQLRENLINTPRLNWLLHAFFNLGQDCQIIFGQVPSLESARTDKQLLNVLESIGTGHSLNLPERLTNAVLIPLVVAHHLAQYVTLLEQRELTHADNVTGALRGAVGLCTGLLGASAVAGSQTQADLEKYGAAAVRLGLLAGLAVDLCETNNGQSNSLSVGWSSAELNSRGTPTRSFAVECLRRSASWMRDRVASARLVGSLGSCASRIPYTALASATFLASTPTVSRELAYATTP